MNKYRLVKVIQGTGGGDIMSRPCYMDESVHMFDALASAYEMATANNAEVQFSVYNQHFLRWEIIEVFHADGTATDSFGERRKWTGLREHCWAPIENEKGGEQ